jgi:hypothetical protein
MLKPSFAQAICAVFIVSTAPLLSSAAVAQTQSSSNSLAGTTPASAASSPTTAESKAELKAQRKAERKQARAQKNAELKQLEDSGYKPDFNNPAYPQNLQDAEKAPGSR